jgi:YesN/AraC family two-component response regulator
LTDKFALSYPECEGGTFLTKSKKKFFIKLLSFITIIATFPVLIVGLFSYLKSSDIIQSNMTNEKEQSVYQIQANFEQVLQTVDLSVTNFVTSYQLTKTLEEPMSANQFQIYNQTKKEINLLQRFDGGMDDFLLVSTKEGWRINNNGLRRLKPGQAEELIDRYGHLSYTSSWIIEDKKDIFFDSTANSSCKTYINLVKQLPLTSNDKSGIAIAYIPICYFENLLKNNLDSETIMVLDENYQVVGHSDFSNIGEDFSNRPFTAELSSQKGNVGQYNASNDGSDYKVIYRKSAYNNWTYLSIIKISELNKQSRSIGWFTFIISSIMFIGILIFALIASRKLYAPINRLTETLSDSFSNQIDNGKNTDEFGIIESRIHHMLEQNDQLESKLHGQIGQLKQFFMSRLLQGKLTAAELPSKLESFNYPMDWKRFSVLGIQIDSSKEPKILLENEDLLLFAINTMVGEMIPKTDRMTPIVINRGQVTILFNEAESEIEFTERITSTIKAIRERIDKELNISVSVGISKTYTDLVDAHLALNECREALRYTLKFGPGSIIFFDKLQRESSFFTFYPRQIENDLFDSIKNGDKAEVDENLDKLLESLFDEQLNNRQFEIAIVRLLTNLIQLTETLGVNALEFEKHKSLFDQLYEFRTLPEVVNWFKNMIIYPMMNKAEERTQSQYKNISDEIIHIVQQEFDSDLTLNYIADKLHYNANYLSSIFRKETNMSFSDYLTHFRINKAKKWLEETDITVKEIAEKLNYNNSQNFIRSFRKVEGTTPGKYRDTKRNH